VSYKQNFDKGTVEDFRRHLPQLQRRKENFTVMVSGMTRKIILKNGSTLKYFGSKKSECRVNGAFMVNMTKKDIDAYIEKHGTPTYSEIKDVQNFNFNLILKAIAKKTPVMGIDINACYWNVAKKLGYLSDRVYQRGLQNCSKQGLLVAIGCLAKKPLKKVYINGQFAYHEFDDAEYQKYSPFYWQIIEQTYNLMNESYDAFADNWYMFLTDCIFVDIEKFKVAQKFLSEKGFGSKVHLIEFISYDGNMLKWYDHKDCKEKQIFAANRRIQDTNALFCIKKAMLSSPSLMQTNE
jgi:hypothetical protein